MSRVYLYAIIDRPQVALPGTWGLNPRSTAPGNDRHTAAIDEAQDDPPRCLSYRDIAAVVGPAPALDPGRTEDALLRHEALVETLMLGCTVLPVRFNTVLADETTVENLLAEHYLTFQADLDRVRDHVELSVRVLWGADSDQAALADAKRPAKTAANGRAYLLARLAEERQTQARRKVAEDLAAALHEPLRRWATQSEQRLLLTPRLLMTAAYLVPRAQVAAFHGTLAELQAAHPDLSFLCTGPWPAYSFVTALKLDAVTPLG